MKSRRNSTHAQVIGIVFAALLNPSAIAHGAPRSKPARFTLDHYLSLRGFSELAWSRDGATLAFVVHQPDTAGNTINQDLWIIKPGNEVRQLTRHPAADFSPSFSPGGDTIAFLSTRGERGWPSIYMMRLSGGEPFSFGSYEGGVGEVHWSPDGQHLAYVMVEPLPNQVKVWQDKGWDHVVEDERLQYPHLWVLEIETGKRTRLTSGENYIWHVRWSPDSRSLAFLVSPTGKPDDSNLVDIAVVPARGGAMKRLGVIGTTFTWSPDGKWIACATSLERDQFVAKNDLWIIPAAGGPPINLTAGFNEQGTTAVWNTTSDTLFFHAAQGVSTWLAAVPFDPSQRTSGPVRLLADRRAEALAPESAPSGRLAWVQSDPLTPHEVWVAEHPGDPGRPVTQLNAAVSKLELATTTTLRWRGADGVEVEGLLLRPPGAREKAALPTLVDLHGGPYGSRHALAFHPRPHFFAAHGYQVLMPNYRASGGYGVAFMLRRRGDWGGQDWRDIEAGVDTLIGRGLADPRRLGLYGRSYGGYLTAWGLTRTTRFDAACVITGAVDLPALFGQSDVQKYRAYEFGGFPWETPEVWRRASPINHVVNVKTPTLILIGERDRRVPLAQAHQLYRALSALSVPTELVTYPREGHHVREPRHRADEITRMLGWWDSWIQK